MALSRVRRLVIGIGIVSLAILFVLEGSNHRSIFHLAAGVLLAASGLHYVARPSVASEAIVEIVFGASLVALVLLKAPGTKGWSEAYRAGREISAWFALAFGAALLVHGAFRLANGKSQPARSALP